MLRSLRIRNLATIEDLSIEFEKGLSILTGETGSGKSIIIDGIRLISGFKGSTDKIRTGTDSACVESIFQRPGPAQTPDLEKENSEDFLVQRIISEKSPGKGYVDGTLVPLKKLRDHVQDKVDIFGQNDHIFLRSPDYQLDYLDHFADSMDLRTELARLALELRKFIKEKAKLDALSRERMQKLDFLDFQIDEIESARIRIGEEQELRQKREILKNSEKIENLTSEALAIAYEKDQSIGAQLSHLKSLTENLAPYDPSFLELHENLSQFDIVLNEFSNFLMQFRERQTSSPEDLESLEGRLDILTKLKRKYGDSEEKILDFLKTIKEERQSLETSQDRHKELQIQIKETFQLYEKKAAVLYEKRMEGKEHLEREVEKEIGVLGMKKARFQIRIEHTAPKIEAQDTIKDSGTEIVDFLISPNPGEDLKPLRRIASGGELSRIMLALKSIGRDAGEEKTLIFDEIDSGIGGKIAEFIAQKLKKLACGNQVICVTHLPQIACYADQHFCVDKKVIGERTFTTVKKLCFEDRVKEIARLIAGSRITDIVMKNAREMLSHRVRDRKDET